VQKRNKTNATWRSGGSSRAVARQSFFQRHSIQCAYAEPSRAESLDSARLVLNGNNMLGLCDPSNLLFEYSFYPPRSDVLFSDYFEDLLENITSSAKPKVHIYVCITTPSQENRANCAKCTENLVKFLRYKCGQTDRQTDCRIH